MLALAPDPKPSVVGIAKLSVGNDASCIITHAYQPCLLQHVDELLQLAINSSALSFLPVSIDSQQVSRSYDAYHNYMAACHDQPW